MGGAVDQPPFRVLPGRPARNPVEPMVMPDLTQFALYFAAALMLAITPGPGIF